MKRTQAILQVAITLSLARAFDWQRHPNAHQQKRQDAFIRQAEKIVIEIETAMIDFRWEPE